MFKKKDVVYYEEPKQHIMNGDRYQYYQRISQQTEAPALLSLLFSSGKCSFMMVNPNLGAVKTAMNLLLNILYILYIKL